MIQLPEPMTISLLGSLEAILPTEEAALLELRVDVAGTLNFTEGTLSIDASLRGSRVVGLTLTGDMSTRASLLDNPSFLMSFGGFNPHFTPPADLADLDRLSVALDTGENLRLGLSGYFALTSNTVQFGAAAELWAKALGLTVEGSFEFDALIQFNPFLFIIDLGFSVEVRAGSVELFGVHLALLLEGPNPWYVLGTATIKILGLKKDFRVEVTIGNRETEGPRETVYARALLIEALEDPEAWVEVPPDPEVQPIILGEGNGSDPSVRLHPAGSLEVRQRIVPLERTLDHYGSAKLGDLERFELLSPTVGGEAVASSTVEEWFAPAQFFELEEEEKLSSPSFEEMPSGLRLGDDRIDAAPAREFELDYEQIVRDPDLEAADQKLETLFVPTAETLARAVKRSAAAQTRKAAGLATSAPQTSPFALESARYVVIAASSGEVSDELTPAAGVSWTEAREALLDAPDSTPRTLVPSYEIEEDAA